MKPAKVLPKTTQEIANGGLYSQRVRCGKSNCKCARGEMHTAFYFFARIDGKLIKHYVRKADVKNFAALVEEAGSQRREKRQSLKSSAEMLKEFRIALWTNDALVKALRES